MRDVHRPALSFENYIAKISGIARHEQIASLRSPKALLWFSLAWREHGDTLVAASSLQQSGMSGLAWLARRLGYDTSA